MGSGEAAMRCAGDGGQHHYFHARLGPWEGLLVVEKPLKIYLWKIEDLPGVSLPIVSQFTSG